MTEFLSGNQIDDACFPLASLAICGGMVIRLHRQGAELAFVGYGCSLTRAVLLTDGLVVVAIETGHSLPMRAPESVAVRWTALSMLTGLLGGGTWRIGMSGQLRLKNRIAEIPIEDSADARARILDRVSHEIRTPLNGIWGTSHLRKETSLSWRQTAYFEMIEDTARPLEASALHRIFEHTQDGALGRPRSLLLVYGQAAAPFESADRCVAREQSTGSPFSPFQIDADDDLDPDDVPVTAPTSRFRRETMPLQVLPDGENSANQVDVRLLLEKCGHTGTVVSDGRGAVARFVSGRHDLILMEISMPRMEGLCAMRQIPKHERAHREFRKLPIVALTACSIPEDRFRRLAAGSDGYLTGPICPAKLYVVISLLTDQADAAPSDPGNPPHNEAPAASSCPDTPGPVVWDAARRRTAHDRALSTACARFFFLTA